MAVTGLHYSLDDDFIIGYKAENASTVYNVNLNMWAYEDPRLVSFSWNAENLITYLRDCQKTEIGVP